jgi:hypothetical protein
MFRSAIWYHIVQHADDWQHRLAMRGWWPWPGCTWICDELERLLAEK